MTQYTRPRTLVDGDWLQARLDDPNSRIIDCDPPDAYRRAHIPGAVSPKDNRFKDPERDVFVMTPPQFAAAMSELGIGDETEVVLYDASGSLNAGRLWWCLAYYGHEQVRVLDGGWNLWLKQGRPVTMAEPKVTTARFTPRPVESLHASAEYVMRALKDPGAIVLDVRSDGEWAGTNNRGNKRAGRMPGAVHVEWLNNLSPDDERRFKSDVDLRAQFEAAGVTPDKEVVTVCQGGIRAAQAALTLKLLGYERVRNYDGSFREWGNRDDTAIE